MRKRLKAFTLVEMLIVMGIIIILMALGIASGRFAIRRANKIEHQNAAEQIYQAMQSYYSDNREYPCKDLEACDVDYLMTGNDSGDEGPLAAYYDDFEGGSEASYMYLLTDDTSAQEAIVCVTYGGASDENMLGMYCTGNGIGSEDGRIPDIKDMEYGTRDYFEGVALFTANTASDWDPTIDGPDKWDTFSNTFPENPYYN